MGRFSELGHRLHQGDISIDFVGRKWLWYGISGVIILLAVAGLSVKGLNLGIEFVGGTEYRVSLPAAQVNQGNVDKITTAVADTGIKNAEGPIVNTSGSDSIRVQTKELSTGQSAEVGHAIAKAVGVNDNAISTQEVGASWGTQVAQKALTGLIVFLVLVVLFIWAYFREWKMSVSALVALAHDLVITIGVYALSGFEVTPATVTGLLTILGFSLYDTVVVFDKVRENTRNIRGSRSTYAEMANLAVNQTLVRSINTSIVALLPVGAILYVGVATLGSGALKDLALALFVGMAAGAYSSIFVATPLLVQLKSREKVISEQDRRARARARRDADRYADVPYAEDTPVTAAPGASGAGESAGMRGWDEEPPELAEEHDELEEPVLNPTSSDRGRDGAVPPRRRDVTPGSGRVAPRSKGPMRDSGASGRSQPSRQSRSQRGKRS